MTSPFRNHSLKENLYDSLDRASGPVIEMVIERRSDGVWLSSKSSSLILIRLARVLFISPGMSQPGGGDLGSAECSGQHVSRPYKHEMNP